MTTFQLKFSEITRQIFDFGILKHEERKKELQDFYYCVEMSNSESKARSIADIESFMLYKNNVRQSVKQLYLLRISRPKGLRN